MGAANSICVGVRTLYSTYETKVSVLLDLPDLGVGLESRLGLGLGLELGLSASLSLQAELENAHPG